MPVLTRLAPFVAEVPVDLHLPEDRDGSLVVALHGMGMSAASFAADALACAPERSAVLVPQGPLAFEMRSAKGMRQGNGWYVYTGDTEAFLASMQRTEEWLLRQVDFALADHALDPGRVALLGFSQGGYLAGWTGVRHAARFRRVVVAAGRIKHEVLEDDARRAAGRDFRVLHVHGEADESVAAAAAQASCAALAAWGVDCAFRNFQAAHAVLREPACASAVREFLALAPGAGAT
jgi:predicted esterase